ncbi:hypothetical protein PCASD_04647 [Puccinia coronata f. sp. avenae]|uniref:Uncharacterized protein n=2 Tax=Puccinia coronata f. sp. avenae TaxID=200324 RepID=A0A2N5TBA9_9BASI|nr:hypothetical protein PCASD_14682 [Puccinia coronata f. sp. avenae]PLW42457.1 hypothetical protein PCASD_04647 [Puccinia coronata f. sp. avenae]
MNLLIQNQDSKLPAASFEVGLVNKLCYPTGTPSFCRFGRGRLRGCASGGLARLTGAAATAIHIYMYCVWKHHHERTIIFEEVDLITVIVGVLDNPIYEAHLTTSKTSVSSSVPPAPLSAHPSYSLLQELGGVTSPGGVGGGQEEKAEKEKDQAGQEDRSVISYARKQSEKGRHLVQLVSHAALDTIDALIWSDKSMYLKQIDRFHEWSVSAWIPPGGMRFVLLHEIKTNDDGIKMFFLEAWESFVRHQMSPFYEINTRINSAQLDLRIKTSARKYL